MLTRVLRIAWRKSYCRRYYQYYYCKYYRSFSIL